MKRTGSGEASFTVEIRCSQPPAEAIGRILDLRQHSRVIPLTTVTPSVAAKSLAVGSRLVARTGLGRLGFDDVMLVEELSFGADGSAAGARISKHGRAIRGAIHLSVAPTPDGSLVRWHQEVRLPWLARALQPLAARVLKLGYRAVLGTLLSGGGQG